MPKGIDKSDWDIVHQMALDVANAAMQDDDTLSDFKSKILLDYLFKLNKKYNDHPSILATIGDYLNDAAERKKIYEKALAIAIKSNNEFEIAEISDELKELELEHESS